MDRNEIIEEIENLISCQPTTASENVETNGERIYNAGYRKQHVCRWRYCNNLKEALYSKCCRERMRIHLLEKYEYCPYCGGRIEVEEGSDDKEDFRAIPPREKYDIKIRVTDIKKGEISDG